MKKILSLLIVLSLAMCTAAAAEDSAMEKALRTVKERISSTEGYDRMDSHTTVTNGKTTYNFNWMAENNEDYRELSVTVTESGVITSYHVYSRDKKTDGTPSVNRKTYDEVLPVCESFLEKINPDIYKSLKVSRRGIYENLGAYGYDFEVQRYENGIPVQGDSGHISVSADGTAVESFYLRYTEGLSFESTEKIISKEEAQRAYGEKLGLKLYYTSRIQDGKRTVSLVYSPAGEYNQYISATSGKVVSPVEPSRGGDEIFKNMASESVSDSAAGSTGFTEAERAELEKVASLISGEKAEEICRKNTVLKISDEYILQDAQLSKNYYDTDKFSWSLHFSGKNLYARVTLDASDGRIENFSKNRNYGAEAKIPPEAAEETAFAAMSVLAPSLFPQDGKSPYVPEESGDSYGFNWIRHENGIPYPQGRAYIYVDNQTGEVVNFNLTHENLEFPSPDNVIANNMALKRLFEQVDYSVAYIKTCSAEELSAYDSAALVYVQEMGTSAVMDAETGDLLYNNREDEIVPYSDISGHFAEKAAETLRKYGVGFSGGKFMPDELITQGELIMLLNCIFGNGYQVIIKPETDFKTEYNTAVRNGMLKNEDYSPESHVTREQSAIMIIRAMGLESAASLQNIYICPFGDVTQNKGYVTILGAMGVFSGDGMGNFKPAEFITRGEAAVVLYNYLSK